MTNVVDRPVMSFEGTVKLVQDQDGSPVVSVQVYFDDPEAPDAFSPGVIRLYLEPLEAKHLSLAMLRVAQDGCEEEIRLERLSWRLK